MAFKIDASIDLNSLARQLKAVSKRFGDTQEQATKRWGVSVARDLALRTQAFGVKAQAQKMAILADARQVIYTHTGSIKKTKSGFYIQHKNVSRGVKQEDYLKSPTEINDFIDSQRTARRKRTKPLPTAEKKVCSEAALKRAINLKHKEKSGMAKDGYLDAGDHISRGQKGVGSEKIGASYIKWARKPAKLGKSKRRRRGLKTHSVLINKISYIGHNIGSSDISKSTKIGAIKMLKWYKKTMAAEAKKRRPR
tara:strand:- start:157 stop:912 length:756 start_codon:yes stop_codon:yes gene_type:complete